MDNSDGIEGLYMERFAVAKSDPKDLLGGTPYHHYLSTQVTKEQVMLQVRGRVGGVGCQRDCV